MTAQNNDFIFHRRASFEILNASGMGMFDPKEHGIAPCAVSTACWRGYRAEYAIKRNLLLLTRLAVGAFQHDAATKEAIRHGLFGIHPRYDEDRGSLVYEGLSERMPFTGTLLLGARFIQKLYVHAGFQSAWKYQTVRELKFNKGRLIHDYDRSAKFKILREKELRAGNNAPPTLAKARFNILQRLRKNARRNIIPVPQGR